MFVIKGVWFFVDSRDVLIHILTCDCIVNAIFYWLQKQSRMIIYTFNFRTYFAYRLCKYIYIYIYTYKGIPVHFASLIYDTYGI